MSHALLQAWAKTLRRRGGDRALVQAADGLTVTFREFDARAAAWRLAHAPDRFMFVGRAVVFAAPPGLGWWEIFLGLLQAGAVVVPLDGAEPPAERQAIAHTLRAGAWWDGTKLELLPNARRFRSPELCLIKLTSGSTGRPRPLRFTADQLLADARQVTATMGIGPGDLNYGLIPPGHSYGLGNLVVPLLAQGVPLVCGSAPLPQAIGADFARWRPSVFPGVPALWRALTASTVTLPGLRLAVSAGAPLPEPVARDFAARYGIRLHNFYGSSETGGIAYDRTGAATLAGGVGRALRGVTVTARAGARVEVSSAAVMTHGNRRRHGSGGRWLMADRVKLDPHGELVLLGRRGTSVKIGGRRVELADVADRLRRLPGVREAWAGVSPGPEPVLGAVVATDRTAAELRTALSAGTAAWKIPKRFVVVTGLPLTVRGKPDSPALQELAFRPRQALTPKSEASISTSSGARQMSA
jgi:acyl-CoA synthetase (AMP-forming)/AMP-acid ligase II